MGFENEIGGGEHQRVAGVQQVRHRPTRDANQALFEADTLVFFQYRRATFTNNAIALTDGSWNMAHLIAASFPGPQLPIELTESFSKEGTDEIRLQLARLGLF